MENRAVGYDVGTMFCQVAEMNEQKEIEFKTIRNSFVELEEYVSGDDIEEILKQNKWQYVSDGKNYYIIGSDSMKVSQIFPNVELRRPMQDGVLNKKEDKKMLVMAKIIEDGAGKSEDNNSLVCFCTSSKSIDNDVDDIFHRSRLEGIFKKNGWKTKRIDEGLAIIFSENPKMMDENEGEIPYTGIGISMGAGKVNVVLAFKGLQILGFSSTRSGDWISKKVSEQTDTPLSVVDGIKENKLDFSSIDYDNDVIYALQAYYQNLIEYSFRNIAKQFKKIKTKFSGPIDIILSGGTASPPHFEDKVKEVVKDLELPFEIKSIRVPEDPKTSVVRGLLTQAIISQKNWQKMKNGHKKTE